jgi:2-dehydropantoate 2-reductase
MRILIVGAGAVGGYYGARLQAGGHQVTFLARGARLAALQRDGLRLQSPLGDLTLPASVIDARATPPRDPVDLTLITVKAYDTAAALAQVPPTGAVLTIQNGVENADRLLAAVGPERALGGTCRLEVDAPEPGLVVHTSPFADVTVGPIATPAAPHAASATKAFADAGIEARLLPDGRTAMWRKAMFLSPFSALTALLDRPWGPIRAHPEALAVAESMAREIAAAGTAVGVPGLGSDAVETALAMFRAAPDAMTSSLHRDRRRGRPLELDDQLAAILRAASRGGTAAPTTAAIHGCLTAIAPAASQGG